MNREHTDRGDSPDRASGPFAQGGRFYMLVLASGWGHRPVRFLYDFKNARRAVEFVRYGLAPGAMTGGRDAWAQGGIFEQAAHFFPTDSPRREEFDCLIGACDAVLSRVLRLDDAVLSTVVWGFNSAFDRALDDQQWRPPVPHRIALCGTLTELLAESNLVKELWEQVAAGPTAEHAFKELVLLLERHEFDESDPEHRALAKEYFEGTRVLTR